MNKYLVSMRFEGDSPDKEFGHRRVTASNVGDAIRKFRSQGSNDNPLASYNAKLIPDNMSDSLSDLIKDAKKEYNKGIKNERNE